MTGIPAVFDKEFARQLKNLGEAEDDFDVINGSTMCASDFYEGTCSDKYLIINYSMKYCK